MVRVCTALSLKYELVLIDFLLVNGGMFTWGPSDMLGIFEGCHRALLEHPSQL
jgi:hypothetical protein